jgi:hypothetical protein
MALRATGGKDRRGSDGRERLDGRPRPGAPTGRSDRPAPSAGGGGGGGEPGDAGSAARRAAADAPARGGGGGGGGAPAGGSASNVEVENELASNVDDSNDPPVAVAPSS